MKGKTETRICAQCNEEFLFEIWRGKYYPGRFCSRACKDMSQRVDLESRFTSYLSEPTETGCVEWMATTSGNNRGYGRVHAGNGSRKMLSAHRLAWELANGQPVPNGYFVCHKCDNPRCVNPDHLFLGKPKVNSQDMTSKNRHAYGERQGTAKLTEAIVREIFRIHAMGELTNTQIAKQFGVSKSTIRLALARKTWKHVAIP